VTGFDVCVVGGGLVGLATARALAKSHPGISLLVLEKEPDTGLHQSSHNSGVVHSGLYYQPSSLKARLCVEGRESVYALCEEAGIPAQRSGKIVLATDKSQLAALDEMERRGRANGLVDLRRIGPGEIQEIEPYATGVEGLHVVESGVADFPGLVTYLTSEIRSYGAEVLTSHPVSAISHTTDGAQLIAGDQSFDAKVVVNCAGLHSDRVAELAGLRPQVRIIPFRGEYYRLDPAKQHLVKALIYPVPDPRFPFLGVHFTRRIDGSVEVGPNAVLALGREHYRGAPPGWSDVRETLTDKGFRKLALANWRAGMKELLSSRSRVLYARLARSLVPAIEHRDLLPGGAGVRAQAVSRDGRLVDDFVIEEAGSTIHVLNAPSPGATASLAIGRHIAERAGPLILR
jgi:(S)-2-hydroxyglutarate dehydrogenase